MKIKGTNMTIAFIPENDEDAELLKSLFLKFNDGNFNYSDYELLDNGTLIFQTV